MLHINVLTVNSITPNVRRSALISAKRPVSIQQENCLHCGNCFEVCPVRAIIKKG